MKAGKSQYKVGTKIRIKGLTGDDADLNGRTGRLTHPFGCFPVNYVGVWLDRRQELTEPICNLKLGEFEVIEGQTNGNQNA